MPTLRGNDRCFMVDDDLFKEFSEEESMIDGIVMSFDFLIIFSLKALSLSHKIILFYL